MSSNPDIIYTQQFRIANGARYLKYTERKEAIDPEEIKIDIKNIQQDPDLPKDFKGYLGYTDRKAATKMEDDLEEKLKGDYPTFSQGVYELSEKQHERLINSLKEAQANKSMLWAGVISFSPEFLTKSGIYDPKTKKVNQKLIKKAVQNAMPGLLAAEGLDNSETFWWGDIHLNTNHVHVHLAISQRHNTRPLKDGMPKGMFMNKSIRKFKSDIHHQLENRRSRSRMIDIEKNLDDLKKSMKRELNSEMKNDLMQQQNLKLIYDALPLYKDKRRWRASNHSRNFKEARELTEKLVNNLLENNLKGDYNNYLQLLRTKDTINRQKYGQRINDTVTPADKELKNYLVNRIFDVLREYDGDEKSKKVDQMTLIKSQGPQENVRLLNIEKERLKQIDPDSKEARKLKMRMGIRRYYIKQVNLDAQISALDHRINNLKPTSGPLKDFFLNTYNEQRELLQLKKVPRYSLKKRPDLVMRYEELSSKYFDETKLPINKINPDMVQKRKNQLNRELKMILQNRNDPAIGLVIPNPNSEYEISNTVAYYRTREEILDLKMKIKENNLYYQGNPKKRDKTNGLLFRQLKRNYAIVNDSELLDQNLDRQLQYIAKQRQKNRNNLSKGSIAGNLSQLLGQINREGHSRIQALRRHLDQEDEIEREDRAEEREY